MRVSPPDDAREPLAVFCRPHDVLRPPRTGHERMHVIEGAARLWEPGGQRAGLLERHLVPSDVRYPQRTASEPRDFAFDQPQALRVTHLFRALEQQLHPEADPEHGHARLRSPADQRREA